MEATKLVKNLVSAVVVMVVVCLLCSANASTVTVLTFSDPAAGSLTPLFTVDLSAGTVSGGWDDSKTGLSLVFFNVTPTTYQNTYFTMTNLTVVGGGQLLTTSGGTIKFYDDGQNPATTPLLQINFDSAYVSTFGLGATDLYQNNVTFSGTKITSPVTDESFSFSFSNQQAISGNLANGYTATAALTSSATIIPEPATIMLIGIGGLIAMRRKKQKTDTN